MKAKIITKVTFWKSSFTCWVKMQNDQFTHTVILDLIYLLYTQLEKKLI